VFVGKNEMITNQIIFPEDVNAEVFRQPPYRDHKGVRDTFNANDRVLKSDRSGVLCRRASRRGLPRYANRRRDLKVAGTKARGTTRQAGIDFSISPFAFSARRIAPPLAQEHGKLAAVPNTTEGAMDSMTTKQRGPLSFESQVKKDLRDDLPPDRFSAHTSRSLKSTLDLLSGISP
jgi:hypothetical protein